jgi:hypothetical protein
MKSFFSTHFIFLTALPIEYLDQYVSVVISLTNSNGLWIDFAQHAF